MKVLALMTGVLALAAASAEAAPKNKRSSVASEHAQATQAGQHPHGIYLPDGELVGKDPDPFIRLMIRRDPKPSQASGI
jgi:hypothetical protein